MSTENIKAYFKALTMDLPQLEKLQQSSSVQDIHNHAAEMGYEFTIEELAGVLIEVHQGDWTPVEGKSFEGELSIGELESVAGGGDPRGMILRDPLPPLVGLLKSIVSSLTH